MITERRPDVSPFSAIVSIANWLSGTSFPNHYVRVSNGGFAKGGPERSPSENGRLLTLAPRARDSRRATGNAARRA